MAVRYLLDTNTASYIIKGNVPQVRERLLAVPMAEVGVSAVTEAELRFAVARLEHAAKLALAVDEFLLRLEVLPWDSTSSMVLHSTASGWLTYLPMGSEGRRPRLRPGDVVLRPIASYAPGMISAITRLAQYLK